MKPIRVRWSSLFIGAIAIALSAPAVVTAQSKDAPTFKRAPAAEEVKAAEAFQAAATQYVDAAAAIRRVGKASPAQRKALTESADQLKKVAPAAGAAMASVLRKLAANGVTAKVFDGWMKNEVAAWDADARIKKRVSDWLDLNGGAHAVLTAAAQELGQLPAEVGSDAEDILKMGRLWNFQAVPKAHARRGLLLCMAIGGAGILATYGGCVGCGFGAGVWIASNCFS